MALFQFIYSMYAGLTSFTFGCRTQVSYSRFHVGGTRMSHGICHSLGVKDPRVTLESDTRFKFHTIRNFRRVTAKLLIFN